MKLSNNFHTDSHQKHVINQHPRQTDLPDFIWELLAGGIRSESWSVYQSLLVQAVPSHPLVTRQVVRPQSIGHRNQWRRDLGH